MFWIWNMTIFNLRNSLNVLLKWLIHLSFAQLIPGLFYNNFWVFQPWHVFTRQHSAVLSTEYTRHHDLLHTEYNLKPKMCALSKHPWPCIRPGVSLQLGDNKIDLISFYYYFLWFPIVFRIFLQNNSLPNFLKLLVGLAGIPLFTENTNT